MDCTGQLDERPEGSLTEVVADIVGHVDFPITGLWPHAATRGARVSVPVILVVHGDVIQQLGLIIIMCWWIIIGKYILKL